MSTNKIRCQGCAELTKEQKMNRVKASANRLVRYCDRCETLRDLYDIGVEEHEQYRLVDLCDEIVTNGEQAARAGEADQ